MKVKNVGRRQVVICTEFAVDPTGGPAKQLTTIMLLPGQIMDLSIAGLEPVADDVPVTPVHETELDLTTPS